MNNTVHPVQIKEKPSVKLNLLCHNPRDVNWQSAVGNFSFLQD
jgi:hypothetical protein